jgi:hypothetical protein
MENLIVNSTGLPGSHPQAMQNFHILISTDYMLYAIVVAAITIFAYCWPEKYPSAKFPLVNRKSTHDLFNFGSRKNYILNAPRILSEGIQKVIIIIPLRESFVEARRMLIWYAGWQEQTIPSYD